MSDNELIAKFMGLECREETAVLLKRYLWTDGNLHPVSKLRFDTSWDWLMPVVEKIEATPNAHKKSQIQQSLGIALCEADIKLAYELIVEFIKWHNQQPPKPNEP